MSLRATVALSISSFLIPIATGGGRDEHLRTRDGRRFRRYGVPLGVLYSVGLTETGRKDSLQPYALNIEGKARFATSAREAEAMFHNARKSGKTLIDLGCMQINHHYHGKEFSSVAQMLELHAIARGLIEAFAESDQIGGGGPDQTSLFTYSGGPAVPTTSTLVTDLAGDIEIKTAVDPDQGGDIDLLRDGGMAGTDYDYNTDDLAAY
ncbi:hypothetical protein [Breoghania sp.]|uniref:hypothetical protein n=1 Tax=Breoghania sp. TaxID=2065378 RepID=UPI00260E2AFD|nr:hypothetical protein [Breoghania sp.]MDJ0929506.1 hypothetical protein [Breoghania sp.]